MEDSALSATWSGSAAARAAVVVIVLLLTGCGALPRGPAVPFELQDRATVPGLTPAARTWAAQMNPEFEAAIADYKRKQEAETAQPATAKD